MSETIDVTEQVEVSPFELYMEKIKSYLPDIEDETFSWSDVVGILVIKLRNTDSLNKERNESHATQIQLTSERNAAEGGRKTEDFFPTLTLNSSFKSWRVSIPARTNNKNIQQLNGYEEMDDNSWNADSVQIRRRILNDDGNGNGNPALQICYGNDLMPLRELLEVDDYLVLVKRKNELLYEAFGVRKTVDLGNGKQLYVSPKSSSDNTVVQLQEIVEKNGAQDSTKPNKACLEISRMPRSSKVHPLNFIVYGAPGTGKTYSMVEYALAIIDNLPIDEFRKVNSDRLVNISRYKSLVKAGRIVFTTFHQNYGYEEFIQGLRPDKESDAMSFKTVDGVFKTMADRALIDNENNNYVMIVDEINRANISKVFGELITLIEEDKRWGELNETSVMLQSGDQFAVPNNLYIVGTMNSADKSISLIDAALRRRFDFIEQKPDSSLVPKGNIRTLFESLNNNLVLELESTDLLIGHSYFMNKEEKDVVTILNNNIIPLLYEYFYDNRKKVESVLQKAIDKSGINICIVDESIGRLRVDRTE